MLQITSIVMSKISSLFILFDAPFQNPRSVKGYRSESALAYYYINEYSTQLYLISHAA